MTRKNLRILNFKIFLTFVDHIFVNQHQFHHTDKADNHDIDDNSKHYLYNVHTFLQECLVDKHRPLLQNHILDLHLDILGNLFKMKNILMIRTSYA